MKILVNGKEAILKASASFEYVRENPLFTEAEDYTMEIVFPMKDCPQNILIFGPLHVDGVDISNVSFPCEMLDGAQFHKSGILTITSVSNIEVKGQFLEGMSQQNFASSLPDVYLTDIDFSEWDGQKGGWEGYPDYTHLWDEEWGWVGWQANKSGPEWGWDELCVYDKNKEEVIYPFDADHGCEPSKSRRIYLAHLIKLIGLATGWVIDDAPLQALPMYKYILVANARSNYLGDHNFKIQPLAKSLPRWKLKEFLEQLSLFFGVFYYVDERNKAIRFKTNKSMMSQSSSTIVSVDVLDDFSVELVEEESATYRGNKTLKLPDKCNPNGINSCPNILTDPRVMHNHKSSGSFTANIEYAARYTYYDKQPSDVTQFGESTKYLYYFPDIDRWGIITESQDKWIGEEGEEGEQPDARFQLAEIINQYGPLTDGVELKIAPCPLENVSYYPLKEPTSESKEENPSFDYMPVLEVPVDPKENLSIMEKSESNLQPVIDYLAQGEVKEEDMYYDHLWLVIYKGGKVNTREYEPAVGKTDMVYWHKDTQQWLKVQDSEGNTAYFPYFCGFLKRDHTLSPFDSSIQEIRALPKVDETKLYRYKWLTKTLPSPTSIFLINGKKFACLRITAHFSVSGMSELVEGEFYEIID